MYSAAVTRFGHNGMIRVCNLCLEKLATVDEDEDDDRHSVTSSVATTPFAAHQLGHSELPNGLHHSQSPFSASQLFGRTDEPFNLFSIAEVKKRPLSGFDESDYVTRPTTSSPPETTYGPRKVVAPFRRALADDEKDGEPLSSPYSHDITPSATRSKTPVDFPITVAVPEGTSTIQFPQSSPERSGGSPDGAGRSRYDTYAELDGDASFIRSRVQSHLTDFFKMAEPGWRERRESTAYVFLLYTSRRLIICSVMHKTSI
jgi:1-phosphatidylinositol-3-phosphate 5-kinase